MIWIVQFQLGNSFWVNHIFMQHFSPLTSQPVTAFSLTRQQATMQRTSSRFSSWGAAAAHEQNLALNLTEDPGWNQNCLQAVAVSAWLYCAGDVWPFSIEYIFKPTLAARFSLRTGSQTFWISLFCLLTHNRFSEMWTQWNGPTGRCTALFPLQEE